MKKNIYHIYVNFIGIYNFVLFISCKCKCLQNHKKLNIYLNHLLYIDYFHIFYILLNITENRLKR